ncbi:hypothetical protein CMO96_00365 [Candidatus Woesebacteria bacterium]|nr:hypothetical protein [Candidatus Woesebacteria bacterium]|tara:strand:- start:50 stop:517 length:468 start_codon:yes stop_codon:yes gene_type:complete
MMPQTYQDEAIIIEAELSAMAEKIAIDLETFILRMKLTGVGDDIITSTLFTDLKEGGVLFGQFKNGIKNITKDAIHNVANISAEKEFRMAGIDTFMWVTVSGKPCPDCDGRAGEVGTKEYFDAIGNPKSGFSVCGRHCKCQLEPATYKGDTKISR